MLKFHSPKPTKSGESVVKIWNELKDVWGSYKRAKLEDDLQKMKEYAKTIRTLQDDLGITQAEFPELRQEKIKI